MSSKKRRNQSPNQSDSDNDWTLISSPGCSEDIPKVKPEPETFPEPKFFKDLERTNLKLEQLADCEPNSDDGLSEVDLNEKDNQEVDVALKSESRPDSVDSEFTGFQALDTTTDEEKSSRRSSRSSISGDFADYVKLKNEDPKISDNFISDDSEPENNQELVSNPIVTQASCSEIPLISSPKEIGRKLNEFNQIWARHRVFSKSRNQTQRSVLSKFKIIALVCVATLLINILVIKYRSSEQKKSTQHTTRDELLGLIGKLPSSQRYIELKNLHNELSQCIKRQSPTSFKYYMSKDRAKSNSKSISRGLVCYGQEGEWRRRIDQLKSDYDLDLPKLMNRVKNNIRNEILAHYHPALRSQLILNQIEYLEYLESKREQRQSEETIKQLKAENLQLLRRLNQPTEIHNQKLVLRLDLENNKLRRENEVLKGRLVEKAGSVYIKQSIELDSLTQENNKLRRFLYDVNREVSRGLRKFNIYTVDASMELNDLEIIDSQISLTKSYLNRLTDNIGIILIDNASLKEQLKTTHLQTMEVEQADSSNPPLISGPDTGNTSRAMANTCARNLMNMKEKNEALEAENVILKRRCNSKTSVDLELAKDRHLNMTRAFVPKYQNELYSCSANSLTTAISQRLAFLTSQTYDGLIDQIIANLGDEFMSSLSASVTLDKTRDGLTLAAKSEKNVDFSAYKNKIKDKILPNYIQEAVRIPQVKLSPTNKQEEPSIKLPPTPPPISSFLSHRPIRPPQTWASTIRFREAEKIRQFNVSGSPNNGLAGTNNISKTAGVIRGDHKSNVSVSIDMRQSGGWFFKRSQRREQLRNLDRSPDASWIHNRAKLREHQRLSSARNRPIVTRSRSLKDRVDKKLNKKKKKKARKAQHKKRNKYFNDEL